MKKLFYFGWLGLLLFEIANVYFIMPMPGSQQMDSLGLAYLLHQWRWGFRVLFAAMILYGLYKASWKRKWALAIPLILLAALIYITNFTMAADHMFYQPNNIVMATAATNKVDNNRLVIGVVNNGQAKAYPIKFLGYHHQLIDTVGGKPLLVTYCTVCRTGRVYSPSVNDKQESFRLVGMDHFNAMLEDATTKSWWRQATGEAVAGPLKGAKLQEYYSTQTSLATWLELYPATYIMQEDPGYKNRYDTTGRFESGKSTAKLTGTDSLSWKNKSWVVGVKAGNETKAYDWKELQTKRLIADKVGGKNIIVLLAKDDKSFFAFERPDEENAFFLQNDTLLCKNKMFAINGKRIDSAGSLKPLPAYQEFWHSWKTFQPETGYKQ